MRASALVLLMLGGVASGQGPEGTLAAVRARLVETRARGQQMGDFEAARLARALEEPLRAAPAPLRREGCRLARALVAHAPGRFCRLAGIGTVARLAVDSDEVPWLLEQATSGGPTGLRELAFLVEHELARVGERAVYERLLGLFERPDPLARRLGLGLIARLESEERLRGTPAGVRRQVVDACRSAESDARRLALVAAGRLGGLPAAARLLGASTSEEVALRAAAARGLGYGRAPASEVALGRLLADSAAIVREEAALAVARRARSAGPGGPEHPDRALVPRLIERLAADPLRLRDAQAAALEALTGRDFPAEPEPWRAWWKRQEAGVEAEPPRYERRSEGPRWHDLPLSSDRLLFVLDVSGSMGESVGESSKVPNRLERAQSELLRVLDGLDERTRFGLLAFSHELGPWSERPVPATAKARASAARFVKAFRAHGGTDTLGALEHALRCDPQLDSIYLLSDGIPSSGRHTDPFEILREIEALHRRRPVRVHTVGMLEGDLLNPFARNRERKDEAAEFLRLLARTTGGGCRILR